MNARLKFVLITIATAVAVGVTGSLAMWQLSRGVEKRARQTAMEAQSAKPPINAAFIKGTSDSKELLHQRARLKGTWVQGSMVFLENRPMNGRVGFLVLMPFILDGEGEALVVQRGWVPRGFEDRTLLPKIDTPAGMVEIEGRIALPPSDLFSIGDHRGGVIRQNLDLPQLRAETGLPLMPITLQQTGETHEAMVRDWPAVNMGVEKNYGYAAQWFGLASLFVLLYMRFQIFRRLMESPKGTAPDA